MTLRMGHFADEKAAHDSQSDRRPLWRRAARRQWPPYALIEDGIEGETRTRLVDARRV